MGITVKEALGLPVLQEAVALTGHKGLDRVITWVTILEVLDQISQLQKGDLLITTAFGLQNDDQPEKLIETLAAAGLAGLVIQTGYYLTEIPQKVVEQCERYGLPLLQIPKWLSFGEITKAILKRVVNRNMAMLETAQQINSRFTQIVLNNEGLDKIAQVLAELIKCPIVIFNHEFTVLSAAGLDAGSSYTSPGYLQAEQDYLSGLGLFEPDVVPKQPVAVPGCAAAGIPDQLLAPLVADNEVRGYVSVKLIERQLTDIDLSAVAAASTVSSLVVLKEIAVLETESRIGGDFFNDLIEGGLSSPDALHRRARYLGYDLTGANAVMVVDIDQFGLLGAQKNEKEVQEIKRKLFSLVRLCLYSSGRQTLVTYKSDNIIILLQATPERATQQAKALAEIIRRKVEQNMPFTVSIGIGQAYERLTNLPNSFWEAERALEIGKKLWKKNVIAHYDELGVYRLFFTCADTEEMRKFYNCGIGKLIGYEQKRNTGLVKTLEVFIQCNGELKATADQLFIHRHTLKYRLGRIKDITGYDPENYQDRFVLQLGLVVSGLLTN